MKKKIVISSLCALSLVMVVIYQNKIWAATEYAETPEVPTRLTNIPFSDIASVLNDDTVASILEFLKLGVIVEPAKGIAKLFYALEQFEKDIRTAQATAPQLRIMATCSQYPKVWRTDHAKYPACQTVGCDGTRAECLKKAIEALKTILKPFIQGTLVGYDADGKHTDGIAYILMDIVQQSNAKGELAVVAEPLKKVMRVLDVLEKNIQSRGTKS